MNRFLWSRCSWLLLSIVLLFTGCTQPQQSSSLADSQGTVQRSLQQPLVVFLVRHAEKLDSNEDAELSPDGTARADSLVNLLRDCDIEQIHSTNFARTRNTAAPTARNLNLQVQIYDAADPSVVVEKLRSVGGRHLVVGHSNTVPSMVELLGGDPGPEIGKNEYDRLYIVMIGRDGETTTVPIRYGKQLNKPDDGL